MSLTTVLAVATCLGCAGYCFRRFSEMRQVERVRADVQRRMRALGWL